MSNFKRKKPRPKLGPRENWNHKPEPDPEPDPSKCKAVGNRKKPKKEWAINVGGKKLHYTKYVTEKQAIQAMEALQHRDNSWVRLLARWPVRKYKVVYIVRTKLSVTTACH